MSGVGPPRQTVIGVSVGTVGIKGSPVDLRVGQCTADRARLLTPSPASPQAVGGVIDTVVELLCRGGPVGVALPAAMRGGVLEAAPALGSRWIGVDVVDLFTRITGRGIAVIKDSDAAGLAEMRYGAGRQCTGVVVVISLGTGIESALFVDGMLVPNTDLGNLPVHQASEDWTGESIDDDLSWMHYAHRIQAYLDLVERLLWPGLVILAGPASTKADAFLPHLNLRTRIVPARLRDGDASIIGAALAAAGTPVPAGVSARLSGDAT